MLEILSRERPVWFAAAASTIAAAGSLILAISFWRTFPYWDQWRAVLMYQAWTEQQIGLWQFVRDHIVAQHNEHRVPLTEIAFLIDFIGFSGSSVFLFPVLIGSYIVLGLAVGLVIARDATRAELAAWLMISLAFALSPIQIDNLTLPFHLLWALSGLLALGAFYWTARLAGDKAPRRFAVLACVATVMSVYTSANGLAAAAIVIVMAQMLIARRVRRIAIVAVSTASILSYFAGYKAPETSQFHAILTSPAGLYYFGAYFLGLVGGVAAPLGLPASRFVGFMGLALTALAWMLAVRRREVGPETIALLVLVTFSAASALMTAVGRGGIGAEQALWSRYGTMVVLFWLPLIGAIWQLTRHRHPRMSRTCIPAALVVLVLAFFAGLPFVAEARSRVAIIDKTTSDLLSGRPDTSGSNPPDLVDFLRRHHLSIFRVR